VVWTSPSCCSRKCLEEAEAVRSEAAAIHLVAAPVLQGDRDIRTVIRMGSGFELGGVLSIALLVVSCSLTFCCFFNYETFCAFISLR
jgi:hypothetical protein